MDSIVRRVHGAIITVETAAAERRYTGWDAELAMSVVGEFDIEYAAKVKAEADANANFGAELTPIS